MALPYEYTDGEVFLSDFTDYMREVYPDLEVTDEFRANTRITDEFAVAMGQMSLALQNAITSGTNPDISDEEIAKILGTEDGSFDTEGFCDYILSQETYTTSDGKEIKVPNSYDYVYEGDNGDIYVSDIADAPAGSIQLQKK